MHLDSFRASLLGMILGGITVAALIAWFFLAKVTLYEFSSGVEVTEEGRLLATFRPEAAQRVRPGMSALVRVSGIPEQKPLTLPALVFDRQQGSNQAEIILFDQASAAGLAQEGVTTQMEVKVEYLTPAALVMRATGRYFSNNQVPVSPQNPEDYRP